MWRPKAPLWVMGSSQGFFNFFSIFKGPILVINILVNNLHSFCLYFIYSCGNLYCILSVVTLNFVHPSFWSFKVSCMLFTWVFLLLNVGIYCHSSHILGSKQMSTADVLNYLMTIANSLWYMYVTSYIFCISHSCYDVWYTGIWLREQILKSLITRKKHYCFSLFFIACIWEDEC